MLPVRDVCWMNPGPLSSPPPPPPTYPNCLHQHKTPVRQRAGFRSVTGERGGFSKKKVKRKSARLASGLRGKNSFPQPRSAPQAQCMRGPLNVASSSPFQYSLFSKSNTCDIKIKLLSLDLCSRSPDKINRARQHLNTDKENWLRVHFKSTRRRDQTLSPIAHAILSIKSL